MVTGNESINVKKRNGSVRIVVTQDMPCESVSSQNDVSRVEVEGIESRNVRRDIACGAWSVTREVTTLRSCVRS